MQLCFVADRDSSLCRQVAGLALLLDTSKAYVVPRARVAAAAERL